MFKHVPIKTPTPVRQSSAPRKPVNISPVRQSKTTNVRSPSKPKPRIDQSESKTSTIDKSLRTDSTTPRQALQKLTPKLMESLLGGQLISDISLDFGNNTNQITNTTKENLTEVVVEEPQDELTKLKRELAAKNETINQLKFENLSLRKEIEEFISVADKIHANLDQELRQYEAKISALEQENKDLLAENRFYKEQTQKRFQNRNSSVPLLENSLSAELTNQTASISEQIKGIEIGPYFQVKDILANVGTTRNQAQLNSSNNLHTETSINREKTPNTCRNLREDEKLLKKIVQGRNTERESISPLRKSKPPLHTTRHSISSLPKSLTRILDRKGSLDLSSEKRGNTSHMNNSKTER